MKTREKKINTGFTFLRLTFGTPPLSLEHEPLGKMNLISPKEKKKEKKEKEGETKSP